MLIEIPILWSWLGWEHFLYNHCSPLINRMNEIRNCFSSSVHEFINLLAFILKIHFIMHKCGYPFFHTLYIQQLSSYSRTFGREKWVLNRESIDLSDWIENLTRNPRGETHTQWKKNNTKRKTERMNKRKICIWRILYRTRQVEMMKLFLSSLTVENNNIYRKTGTESRLPFNSKKVSLITISISFELQSYTKWSIVLITLDTSFFSS